MNKPSLLILIVFLNTLISGCATAPTLNGYIADKETDKALKHIQSGGAINEVDANGNTALHTAAWENNTKVLKALLDHGANANAKTTAFRMRPIHFAAQKGDADAIDLLVKHGAKIDATDSAGRTALKLAAFAGNKETVQALLKDGAKINKMQNISSTALLDAINGQHTNVVKLLLDAGANINAPDQNGNTPLIVAAFKENAEITKLLLANKASINTTNKEGQSALIIAAFLENIPIVKLLLNNGADVLATTNYKRSPVHLAAITGNQDLVNILLEHGAKPAIIDTTEDDYFGTALSNGLYGEWLIKNNKGDDPITFLTTAEKYFTKAETQYASIQDDLNWKLTMTALKNAATIAFSAYAAQAQANINAKTSGTGTGFGFVQYKLKGTLSLSESRDLLIEKVKKSHQLKEKYAALLKCISSYQAANFNHCITSNKETSL